MNSYTDYFLKIWLRSIAEPKELLVTKESWKRFRRNYANNRNGFFLCHTKDGRFVGVNLKYVDVVHFLWQSPPVVLNKVEWHSGVVMHMLDGKALSFSVDEPKNISDVFFHLELGEQEDFDEFSFVDVDGEEVMFFPSRLVWLEASGEFVEEGFIELRNS